MSKYSVDYWYRHETDTEQTVREFCQMSAAAESTADVLREIDSLTTHGYHVQKAIMGETCTTCQGAGRVGKAPKDTRKAKIATLPDWRLTWSRCMVCGGSGAIQYFNVFNATEQEAINAAQEQE